jgi:hypothetical protein
MILLRKSKLSLGFGMPIQATDELKCGIASLISTVLRLARQLDKFDRKGGLMRCWNVIVTYL